MESRLLVKISSKTSPTALAANSKVRPLFEVGPQTEGFGLSSESATWCIADQQDLGPLPWDAAHGRVADMLGVDEADVLFAEPDILQGYPTENEANEGGNPFALNPPNCQPAPQHDDQRKPGPGFAWHLLDQFSQLAAARSAVAFADPRTTIAHIDTGYDPNHSARPARIRHDLERNFVKADGTPNDAADPGRNQLFDNSGHGTGTSSILAGQSVPQNNGQPMGGAPEADIVPLRIANSVVLFFTSAVAAALSYAVQIKCDVISMSMGGLPSGAWNDAVNAAYEAGICIVAASGDCFGGLPTHHVVYPARYHRTIAACGVMEDGTPYFNLPINVIEGSWGPDSCMTAALAAWTPNISWAKFGCPQTVDMDGAGTSAATPQVAAAAALWLEKYKAQLPMRNWQRVEAVRNALFGAARKTDPQHFGRGILQANAALAIAPNLMLPKTQPDNDSFAFFRVITGLGIAEPNAQERMLNLELSQVYLMSPEMQDAVPEPEARVDLKDLRRFMDSLIGNTKASGALRRLAASRYSALFDAPVPGAALTDLAPVRAVPEAQVTLRDPAYRRIRTYAVDPSLSTQLKTAAVNQGLLRVPWENLAPGPQGEYLDVQDTPEYGKVDLDDPRLLAQDGFAPSEGNPHFHQQMTYAVAMTTIHRFERALGRKVLWRPRIIPEKPFDDSEYAQRLVIQPHAFAQENAFYDPRPIALRFGYFAASADDPGDHVPGSTVYSCLSHDIVAHETSHAILDGMHRRFTEPTNSDVLAFHEGFADIVALMQHFEMTEVLTNQIARTRGDVETESILGSLALQFGRAIGKRGGLREAIGSVDANGQWHRNVPDPAAYRTIIEPHARGSLLVAAVFDAFLAIYATRTADLYRIYTGGTGVLQPGAVHPDLVNRLANEASTAAGHVLRICIRALDYVPPVDITFGEYLRALITADIDLVDDDPLGYRIAFVEAFRRRGIYPSDLATLSVDTLVWQGVDLSKAASRVQPVLVQLKKFANDCLYIDNRRKLFERTRRERLTLHGSIKEVAQSEPAVAKLFGIDPGMPFEIHELRRAERAGPDGSSHPQVIVGVTQQREIKVGDQSMKFYGGATLVIDLKRAELKYAIRKRIDNKQREEETKAFLKKNLENPLTALLLDSERHDRFAILHALADMED
jgi:hypothetical protein